MPYPAKIKDCNLNSIKYLSKKLNCEIGWSDHSRKPLIINEVISRFNVKFVELHIDLRGSVMNLIKAIVGFKGIKRFN